MKQYLSFNLTGGKVFFFFMCHIFALIIFNTLFDYNIVFKIGFVDTDFPYSTYLLSALISVVILLFAQVLYIFYVCKYSINAFSYRDKNILCTASFGEFIKIWTIGLVLSILTIGIYYPWFIKNCIAYMSRKISINGNALTFKGNVGRLFGCLLMHILASIFILFIALVVSLSGDGFPFSSTNENYAYATLFIGAFIVPKWVAKHFGSSSKKSKNQRFLFL